MSASSGMSEFDLCGPLPRGVTLLEASAGTGKTYAIAALVARLVAEGVPCERLLVVTFTRMATGELRERVRDRLVSAEFGLARALAGVAPPTDDRVLTLLSDGTEAEVAVRRRRLAEAISAFDSATIATTHGFCRHVLAGLGVAGDVEHDVTFVEDLSDLVEEAVDDLYVRRFHRVPQPPFGRAEALAIGRAAVGNPFARLEPLERRAGDETTTWAMRRRLAEAVRTEVETRKRRRGVMTYDDLLTRLRNTLTDEEHGAAACARLRDQYHVALVDEFQDTDPIQWEIMRRAFGEAGATLILIGDPKQAIYSFRGADVYAYLSAAHSALARETLATNWRSDQDLDRRPRRALRRHPLRPRRHRPSARPRGRRTPRTASARGAGHGGAAPADPAPRRSVRPHHPEGVRIETGGGGRDRGRPCRRRRAAAVVVREAGRPGSGRLRTRPTAGAAGPRRGARSDQQARRTRRRRSRARRRPGGDQRRRQRLRDPGRRRLATAARGARAAGLDRPCPSGRTHLVPRLERGADGHRGRLRPRGAAHEAASLGRSSPQPRRRSAARLDLRNRGASPSASSPGWAASAG